MTCRHYLPLLFATRGWLVALCALLLMACVPAGNQAVGDLRVENPWALATPNDVRLSEGYLSIGNLGRVDDRLMSVTSSAAIQVELRESTHTQNAARSRRLAQGVLIPAGGRAVLQAGGEHIALIEPKQPFAGGDVVIAVLHFQRAGDVEVAFQVRGERATVASERVHVH